MADIAAQAVIAMQAKAAPGRLAQNWRPGVTSLGLRRWDGPRPMPVVTGDRDAQ